MNRYILESWIRGVGVQRFTRFLVIMLKIELHVHIYLLGALVWGAEYLVEIDAFEDNLTFKADLYMSFYVELNRVILKAMRFMPRMHGARTDANLQPQLVIEDITVSANELGGGFLEQYLWQEVESEDEESMSEP